MSIKYRCLVLDHDDTAVASSPCIHYPAFLEAVSQLRPETPPVSIEEFYSLSFHPGFFAYYRDVLGLDDDEMRREVKIWESHVARTIPPAIPGMRELMLDFKAQGGLLCVVSHSKTATIERDYLADFGFLPDMIRGLEDGFEKMKPQPWPLLHISQSFDIPLSEMIMVDDLRPGLDMAKKCGVCFVAAGWSHSVPDMVQYMKENADYYAASVSELRAILGL